MPLGSAASAGLTRPTTANPMAAATIVFIARPLRLRIARRKCHAAHAEPSSCADAPRYVADRAVSEPILKMPTRHQGNFVRFCGSIASRDMERHALAMRARKAAAGRQCVWQYSRADPRRRVVIRQQIE